MLNLASNRKINAQKHKFHKSLTHPKKQVSKVSKLVNKTIQKTNKLISSKGQPASQSKFSPSELEP